MIRQLSALAAVLGLAGVLLVFAGCNNSGPQSDSNTEPTNRTGTDQARCDEILANVLDMLHHERLGITTVDAGPAVMLLNNEWRPACAPAEADEPLPADAGRLLRRSFSDDDLERVSAPRFIVRDAEHIRNALLFREITGFAGRAGDDLGRAVRLFEYVVRNVALAGPDEGRLPQTAYDALVLGRGPAEARAWVFAELLRQLRIDAVLLRPQSAAAGTEEGDPDDRFLVGVLLDGGVYLFAPQLGWPVPGPDDTGETPTVRRPATLAEVLEDDALLRRLDTGARPFPLQADDLRSPRVELVGGLSLWAPRMHALQQSLAGSRTAVVFEPLGSDAGGLPARVAQAGAGAWSFDDVALWTWPERNLRQSERWAEHRDRIQTQMWDWVKSGERLSDFQLDPDRRSWLARRLPLDAPVPVLVNPADRQLSFGQPKRDLLKTRMAQLTGDYKDAVANYQLVRLSDAVHARILLPLDLRNLHVLAARDAAFWVGVCQYERGDFESAAETLAGQVTSGPGLWTGQARYLLALSLAEQGRHAAAVQALNEMQPDDPHAPAAELLADRLRTLRGQQP